MQEREEAGEKGRGSHTGRKTLTSLMQDLPYLWRPAETTANAGLATVPRRYYHRAAGDAAFRTWREVVGVVSGA